MASTILYLVIIQLYGDLLNAALAKQQKRRGDPYKATAAIRFAKYGLIYPLRLCTTMYTLWVTEGSPFLDTSSPPPPPPPYSVAISTEWMSAVCRPIRVRKGRHSVCAVCVFSSVKMAKISSTRQRTHTRCVLINEFRIKRRDCLTIPLHPLSNPNSSVSPEEANSPLLRLFWFINCQLGMSGICLEGATTQCSNAERDDEVCGRGLFGRSCTPRKSVVNQTEEERTREWMDGEDAEVEQGKPINRLWWISLLAEDYSYTYRSSLI